MQVYILHFKNSQIWQKEKFITWTLKTKSHTGIEFFLATPTACWNSQARDWTAVTLDTVLCDSNIAQRSPVGHQRNPGIEFNISLKTESTFYQPNSYQWMEHRRCYEILYHMVFHRKKPNHIETDKHQKENTRCSFHNINLYFQPC